MKRYTTSVAAAALLLVSGVTANAQDTQQGQAVPAAEPAAGPAEEIIVTGSRIRRTDVESISPITVLSDVQLEKAGNLTIEDTLQSLPAATGGDFGASVNNGSDGIATISLRGLGPNRTLVLMDGHRPGPAGVDGLVDLNLIPAAFIERVEVLRDGASTIYGSDAIGGVVNIITKKDFEGVKFDIGYDITDEGDGDQYNVSLLIGKVFDEGRFQAGAQWTKRTVIWQADRKFSECALDQDPVTGETACFGSGNTYPARVFAGGPAQFVDLTTGVVRPYSGATDSFNFQAFSYMVTPQDVFSGFLSTEYQILESSFSTVSVYADLHFSKRESDQLLAPEATFWAPEVPTLSGTTGNNPYSPWSDNSAPNSLGLGCGSAVNPTCVPGTGETPVFVTRRLVEAGGRNSIQDADGWNILVGLKGEAVRGIGWDLSYSYGDYLATLIEANRGNVARFDTLLDPDLCAADAACAAAVAGVPGGTWDPFRPDTFTPEMASYALVSPNEVRRSKLRVVQFNLAADSEELAGISLPGGPIGLAMGFEYRKEDSRADPDGSAILGQVYFFPGFATKGTYSVYEEYGEISLPLVRDVPFVKDLTVEGSVRHSNYSSVGPGTSYSSRIEYAPVEDMRLRFVWTEGFRAPNIGELFGPPTPSAPDYADPCQNFATTYAPGNPIYDNCFFELAPYLVGGDWTTTLTQTESRQIGNEALEAEDSTSFTVGGVLTPRFLENFSMTIDWFKITIEKAIGTPGVENIINLCYASVNFSSPLCSLIPGPTFVNSPPLAGPGGAHRDVTEIVSGIDETLQNLSAFETNGVDWDIRYLYDLGFGQLDLGMAGTWTRQFEFSSCVGCPLTVLDGQYGTDPYFGIFSAFPEWQFQATYGFSRDNWGVEYAMEYMSAVTEASEGQAFDQLANSRLYHDITGWVEFGKITLRAGVRNLADSDPPYTTNNNDMNTIPISYRTAGRYFYARASVAF